MKKIFALLLICLPLALFAQTDEKYLEGAVQLVDNKVTFTTEMSAAGMSKENIQETILRWAEARFQPNENFKARVLYQNLEEGSIAIQGDEYIVFKSTALSLDRAIIKYQLIVNNENGKSKVSMSRITYLYDATRYDKEKYIAEEWITDDMALNKSKTKLSPITGKFRKETIDLKDLLFGEIRTALGNQMIAMGLQAAPVSPESQVAVHTPQPVQTTAAAPVVVAAPVKETAQPAAPKATSNDPEALIQQAVRMTITAGNDEQFEINKECWGGFGELFGKKTASCLIDTQKTMGNMLLLQSENYTISFYSSNSAQPSVVIRCKRIMQQTIDGKEAQNMNPSCEVEKSYNLYVGEVIK